MKKNTYVVNTDGGSRGNPGPASSAFVIKEDGREVFKHSKYLGESTNNIAEYRGVILALNWFVEKGVKDCQINFFLDSELVVKQINGLYKVKNEELRNLFFEVISLSKKIGGKIVFTHIRRENNKEADRLVNEELDKNV